MNPFSFVHCSDLHIDSPFKGVTAQSARIALQLQAATMQSYQNIIDLCIERKVDFLVIAGDVYDSANRQIQAQLGFFDGLKRLADHDIRCYIAHGNHDPQTGWCKSLRFEDVKSTVFPVRATDFVIERRGIKLANIVGISYKEAKEERNLVGDFNRRLPELEPGLFNIAVLHCNVGNSAAHANYAPCSLQDLLSSKYDYWALGHVHERKTLSDRPAVVYPGNSQGRNIRERGPKGAVVVTVDAEARVTTEFVATDTVRWELGTIAIDEISTIDKLDERLMNALDRMKANADGRSLICRIELTGRGELYDKLKDDATRRQLISRCRAAFEREKQFCWLEQLDFRCAPCIDIEEAMRREDLLAFVLREAALARQSDIEKQFESELKPLVNRLSGGSVPLLSSEDLQHCLREAELLCVDLLESS